MSQHSRSRQVLRVRPATRILAVVLAFSVVWLLEAQSSPPNTPAPPPQDFGVRTGTVDAGTPFNTLPTNEANFFADGQTRFSNTETVATPPNIGLGPTFNANSCATCHQQPAIGGTSPRSGVFPDLVTENPQFAEAPNGQNIPSFLTKNGPVVEARFQFFLNPPPSGADPNSPSAATLSNIPDGSVHDLFTIANLPGSGMCNMAQPNFAQMQNLGNVSLRIPTPLFGVGLVETITEETIIKNMNANSGTKGPLGIMGVPNRSGNDGTITRFGWKAQNKSGQIFAGEAYNVEMGITNELFPNERGNSAIQNAPNDPPLNCLINGTPEDSTNFNKSGFNILSDVVEFSHFMRFLNQPTQDSNNIPGNPTAAQIATGKSMFENIGCNMCHTESLTTGTSSFDTPSNQFLSNQTANLYSDLLIHHMGGLDDGITQGLAAGDQFRTAPLWGVGQRIFFLHDGRATPDNGGLLTAIEDHDLPPPNSSVQTSEAHKVINAFNNLTNAQQQDILFFLRSL